MKKMQCGSEPIEQTFTECQGDTGPDRIQRMPTSGMIEKHTDLPLSALKSKIGKENGKAYSYVLTTVQFNHDEDCFEQHGSGPNFQGGRLTLCTCKHQMRASRAAEDWPGVWVAGFTSRTIHDGKHWLFYLAQIQSAHESHTDLWSVLSPSCRKAKAADRNFLGDVFTPIPPLPTEMERFRPSQYVAPDYHAHRQSEGDKGWHNDIRYKHAKRYGDPPLLLADPRRTFLWKEPIIYLDQKHCRNFFNWESLQELLSHLRPAKS